MLGTPYYMSPEQAQGIKAVDQRSDLWSIAVIVFQALTGRLPFDSEGLGDLLVKIIVAPMPLPSHFVTRPARRRFDRWWERASQRDPAARFQSAREFGDSLAIAFGHSKGLSAATRAGTGRDAPRRAGIAGTARNYPAGLRLRDDRPIRRSATRPSRRMQGNPSAREHAHAARSAACPAAAAHGGRRRPMASGPSRAHDRRLAVAHVRHAARRRRLKRARD